MRWIAASLVVINIGIFIYFELFQSASVADSGASSSGNVPALSSNSLVLLGEVSDSISSSDSVSDEPGSQVSPEPRPRKPSAGLCSLVGPFEKLLSAEFFQEELNNRELRSEIRSILISSETQYWLHLPSLGSRKEALRKLSELQQKGIDSYVIPSGDLANGISLGVFSVEDRAKAMQAKIVNQGYQPEVVAVPKEQREIWLYLAAGESGKLSDEQWVELLSSSKYLQKRQNLCSDVASG